MEEGDPKALLPWGSLCVLRNSLHTPPGKRKKVVIRKNYLLSIHPNQGSSLSMEMSIVTHNQILPTASRDEQHTGPLWSKGLMKAVLLWNIHTVPGSDIVFLPVVFWYLLRGESCTSCVDLLARVMNRNSF